MSITWATAANHFTVEENGLLQPWSGRVWCNPPYGNEARKWLARLADHGNGIALVFARTETEMFFKHVWPKASAVLFLEGRLNFYRVDGVRSKKNSGGPSCLIAYGIGNALWLSESGLAGKVLPIPS
jgi:hypothetical protein